MRRKTTIRPASLLIAALAVLCAASVRALPVVNDTEGPAEPDWLAGRELEPSWAGGVGLVMEQRCMACHHPGGSAPMSFLSYADTKAWLKEIQVQVSTRAMPPWPADQSIGRFRNSQALSARELALFAEWSQAGFPRGDGDFVPARKWDGEWSIGQPDAVFALPPQTLAAGATVEVRELVVATHFAEDRFVVAAEVKPESEVVLQIDGGPLGAFYPGNASEVVPEGSAYLLAAGDTVRVRAIYRKEAGREETVSSRLGVIFARPGTSITRKLWRSRLDAGDFTLPPRAAEHAVTARLELDQSAEIVALNPVMEARGKSVAYEAVLPGGERHALLRIPAWSPEWRYRYELAEPLRAPRGTVLVASAVYDNSADNPRNPDPALAVPAGPTGERLEGWVTLGVATAVEVADYDVAPRVQHPLDLVPFRRVHTEVNGSADSAVSPDGKWVSFATRRSGNLDVWLADTESGELRRVTSNPSADYEARWSPDGTKLVFVTHRNGSQDVYLLDLKTGEESPIAIERYNEDYPSFSKDGREVVYTGGPGGYREVQVYSFDTGTIRTLTKGFGWVGSTNFSADGKTIVFHAYYERSYLSGKSDLFLVSAQGGEPVNLTKMPEVWDYKASWSPSGDWIAFSSKRSSPNFNLFLIRPDGTDVRQITQVADYDLRWADWTRDGRLAWHQIEPQEGRIRAVDTKTGESRVVFSSEDYVSYFTPSPDGEHVVFETNGKILVLDASAPEKPRELTEGLRPAWSSNGSQVAFQRYRYQDGVSETGMGVIALTGGQPSSVVWLSPLAFAEPTEPWRQGGFDQSWSHDGRWLARVQRGGKLGEVVLVSSEGEERKLLADESPKTSPVWSNDGQTIFFVENRPRSVSYFLTAESATQRDASKGTPSAAGR